MCAAALLGAAFSFVVERMGVPPRALSPYVERRTSDHNPMIVGIGNWAGRILLAMDRGEYHPPALQTVRIGAQPRTRSSTTANAADGFKVLAGTADEVRKAIAQARPGDVITLLPGTYRFAGGRIEARQPGTSEHTIYVRAERSGTVFLEFDMTEGFIVSAPYWTFENLHIQGICRDHSNCEHAFHVVAQAVHFVARNNTIVDFNAHFKINSQDGSAPDFGLLDGNTLTNTMVRRTGSPVTLIDLVGASHWIIRRNLISDFIKAQSDQISYGAFAKGAGSDNRFEQNIVLCEHHLRGNPGQRVGLSLGGGGTGKPYCRDKRCITEQDRSTIQSNLIASCSDDGIYLNRAATSKVLHNTLIDTAGIVVRFVESSADVQGNLVDGVIRSRDGGLLRATDNYETTMTHLYLGVHPVRSLYAEGGPPEFAWRQDPPRRESADPGAPDLCGAARPPHPSFGAFEQFSACIDQSGIGDVRN